MPVEEKEGDGLDRRKKAAGRLHRQRKGALFWVSLILVLSAGKRVQAAELKDDAGCVGYSVSFVDAEDADNLIFHTQTGKELEGTTLRVSFPEQIIGSDGHIWKSAVESPQYFILYGTGTEKFYIEYERGSRVPGLKKEEDEKTQELQKRLERWKQKAWEAECAILGREASGSRPELAVSDASSNDARIRNLVSAIGDAKWHEFYLIGRNFMPSAACIGLEYEAVYSEMEEDSFSLDGDTYILTRIRVCRSWESRTCTHRWKLQEEEKNDCLKHGRAVYACERCQNEKTERLPALGHVDENRDLRCDRCGSGELEDEAEIVVWKEGDVQFRQVGGESLSFTCIDDDYHDWQDGHRKAALFLCDRVIRADVDTVPGEEMKIFSFGTDNNYKNSRVREWLRKNSEDSRLGLEPIHTGIQTAYTGSTEKGAFSQTSERELVRHDIGYQKMNDSLFCLSLEEALAYRTFLWRFESKEENPESQISAYSQGYYLRTPFYLPDEAGNFVCGGQIYGVDLVNGNLHPVRTDSETYGIRPAFAMPQM